MYCTSCYLISAMRREHGSCSAYVYALNNMIMVGHSIGCSGLLLLLFLYMMPLFSFSAVFRFLRDLSVWCVYCLCAAFVLPEMQSHSLIVALNDHETGNSSYTGSSVHILMFSCLLFLFTISLWFSRFVRIFPRHRHTYTHPHLHTPQKSQSFFFFNKILGKWLFIIFSNKNEK